MKNSGTELLVFLIKIIYCTVVCPSEFWHISMESSCLDHRYIRFDVKVGTRQEKQYRDPKCSDWEGFGATLRDSLRNNIRKIRIGAEIELAANHIQSSVLTIHLKPRKEESKLHK
ncbi:hypothetical protein JTB14_005658 [Gonioctena quinquepunctata]|nr:hypothetical protein JTB14_005658 [Gonioctena quinquepunctata]